jgi:hypothetical protein
MDAVLNPRLGKICPPALTFILLALQVIDLSAREPESRKALHLQKALSERTLNLYDGVRREDRPQCTRLLQALRLKGRDIHYVDPVVTTDDPNHPALAHYGDCRSYAGPRSPETFSDLTLSIGTHSFRLYRTDLDGDAANGPEEYIYAEEPKYSDAPSASYYRVDLMRCLHGDVAVVSPENAKKSQYDRGVNALVRFQADHFIISLNEDLGALQAWKYNRAERYFPPAATCYWR